MEHLGKIDHKDPHGKRNTTSDGLTQTVSEQNKDCTKIELDSIYNTFWLGIPWILCVSQNFEWGWSQKLWTNFIGSWIFTTAKFALWHGYYSLHFSQIYTALYLLHIFLNLSAAEVVWDFFNLNLGFQSSIFMNWEANCTKVVFPNICGVLSLLNGERTDVYWLYALYQSLSVCA